MKTLFLMLLSAFMGILSAFGQLNSLHNHYRPGDALIKQQVEYVDPGESGPNQLWNFSKLKTINDEYTLTYSLPPIEGDSLFVFADARYKKQKVADNELIIGTEHNTMYYYHLRGDSLLLTGHENPSVKLKYTSPMALMIFPLNYGQVVNSNYTSKGKYSGTIDIQSQGTTITSADAYGSLILPSGDTLSPVLRTKTVQTIQDIMRPENAKALETCRWYSKGYRYPVFETVRNINLTDSITIFSTAFFYPPQYHLYLDTDPENQALLDELWKETENNTSVQDGKTVTIEDIMICKIYPNPVVSQMNLEYELKQDANVSFDLYSMEGMPVKRIKGAARTKGVYKEVMDCSNLLTKNYILRITANNLIVNEVIIKK